MTSRSAKKNVGKAKKPVPANRSKVSPKTTRSPKPTGTSLKVTQDLLNRLSSAVMFADADFVVTCVNQAAQEVFERHAESFRKLCSDFHPEALVGTSLDRLHLIPSDHRTRLADPRSLPLTTDISVGEARIQLRITPVTDQKGLRNGFTVELCDVTTLRDSEGQATAINRSQAVIEFNLDGTIRTANENFLKTVGYTLEEIRGKHHCMFVDSAYAASHEYRQFWAELNEGRYGSGEYKRFGKGGKEIWIQASYNPILDLNGRPFKVVKYATDVTATKLQSADYQGQLNAIGKSQAVIEFNMDGTIRAANENFLSTVGYTLEEIRGKHHSMFVDSAYANSLMYRDFWARLNQGHFDSGEYKRIARGGREVWIQASYNPILDLNGKPFKVVKYATDVTAAKVRNADYEGQLAAIGKAQATIEFDLEGRIQTANDNFLNTLGYTLDEVRGRHHSMFVDPAYGNSSEYRQFWADLKAGTYQSAQYKRIGKGGREIWILRCSERG